MPYGGEQVLALELGALDLVGAGNVVGGRLPTGPGLLPGGLAG